MGLDEYLKRAHGCYPDEIGNYPCDNGAVCDACMLTPTTTANEKGANIDEDA